MVKACVVSFFFAATAAELALKRKLSFPVSRMWQRWVSRSSSAVVILASPKTVAHSLKLRLVVMMTLEWVDWFNNRRLLEPIGNIPPTEAEANFYAALETKPMAA